jgi:hypothetical protein
MPRTGRTTDGPADPPRRAEPELGGWVVGAYAPGRLLRTRAGRRRPPGRGGWSGGTDAIRRAARWGSSGGGEMGGRVAGTFRRLNVGTSVRGGGDRVRGRAGSSGGDLELGGWVVGASRLVAMPRGRVGSVGLRLRAASSAVAVRRRIRCGGCAGLLVELDLPSSLVRRPARPGSPASAHSPVVGAG